MSYRPFRSQSRVEFIKKKFENSFSEGSETESFKRTNPTIFTKPNFLEELNDLNLEKKVVNLKIESGLKDNYANKSEGKVLVKRSPAFRREKLGGTKSPTQVSLQEKVNFRQSESKNETDNTHEQIFESNQNGLGIWTDFKRSKTDTNLLKYCSNKNKDTEFFPAKLKYSEISSSLVLNPTTHSENEVNKETSAQYSVVKKQKNSTQKNGAGSLQFSESIRRALQSPLPKGPPPKKPPRTFCHVPQFTQTNPHMDSAETLPVSTKTDIPKLKSKLEKLERVIKIHKTGKEGKIKYVSEEEGNHIPKFDENYQTEDVMDEYQSCLPISNCVNQGKKSQNFQKVPKAKSEFYLQVDRADFDKKCLFGKKSNKPTVRVLSDQAIYDMPCVKKKNSFETFGKCSKDLKESVNSIKAESLHYMCTDVINQMCKQPDFLAKSAEIESEVDTLDSKIGLLVSLQKQKSSSMSKIDKAKEFGNDMNMEGKDEKKQILKEVKEVFRHEGVAERSERTGLNLLMNPDHNEVRKSGELEEDIPSEVAARRKVYVSKVASKLINQVPSWKCKNKNTYKHLFECCLLVGLTLCESKQNMPYIKSIFPPDTKPPPLIESLCFPDASYWPPNSENDYPEEQYYSLVVTNENGERKFGYCRRVLPEGGHVCLPLAYCIVTQHRAGGFFNKVLEELESRHGSPGLDRFIKQLYESEFPGPGERLKLKEILEEATGKNCLYSDLSLSSTLVRRPPDVRLEEKDLTQLFQHLHLSVCLKVFSSLLHERKVLLLSSSLRNLSSCIEALQLILLPFSWQHTYIPVLPVHLIELCEAPTPYVMGLLKPRNMEKSYGNINFEDGIFVDLDDSRILKCCGDEGTILPSRFTRDLKAALNLAMSTTDELSESVRSVLISDAFIRFFVQVCGNYSKFIQNLPNGETLFQKDHFIKSATSNAMQSFLDWFTETAMFSSFIQERLQGGNEDGLVQLFRRRAMEYSEESVKDSAVLLKNYKVINKKVRTLGDKIKDFTSFNK